MENKFIDQERMDILLGKVKTSSKKGRLQAWPRDEKELPEVELEIGWVRFSTLNHRTRAEQQQVIHAKEKTNLFTQDPMGETAQKYQYDILCKQSGFDELKADLGERDQQEPAVVTAEGVLINGNRRAAAMRSLRDEDKNMNIQYIRCLVLPEDANSLEFLKLETELQVARDFWEEYSWINLAILIEDIYNKHERDFSKVAALMHRKKKDVEEYYENIQQVHQLVALSKGKLLHVNFVPNESAISEMTKHIRNKGKGEREAVRSAYFLGILADVKYRALRNLQRADASDLIVNQLRNVEDFSGFLEPTTEMSKQENGKNDQLIDKVLGGPEDTSVVHKILEFVAKIDKNQPIELPSGVKVEAKELYDNLNHAVTKATQEAKEQKEDEDTVSAPISRMERALKELTRALSTLTAARAMPDWDEKKFSSMVSVVEAKLNEIKNAK